MQVNVLRVAASEICSDDLLFFERPSYDDAIVGVADDCCVVYDFCKMVQVLVDNEGISEEEAVAFVEGSMQACEGKINAPIVVRPLPTWAVSCDNCARCSFHYPSHILTCDIDNHVIRDCEKEGCKKFLGVTVDA